MSNKRKNYKATDYGEFEFVAKKIYSLKAIRRAHETPYTKKQTEKLLRCLSKKYFKDENLLRLRWITRGGFNWGGTYIKNGKSFPFVDLYANKKNKKKGIFGLRAGIVMHEFSHALANYKSNKGRGHGKEFIKTFNKVLRFYFKVKK